MSDNKATIKLTKAKRRLISIPLRSVNQYEIAMRLDDLEGLIGYVTFEANHTEARCLQKKLDKLSDYLEGVLSEAEHDWVNS